jgi:RNA polymerase sigma-70 factor (ECF subfamily)
VALTLRLVGGLATADVARAFLIPEPTLARRLGRAKQKIREAAIPYEVPARAQLPARLSAVLAVLYLIFNRGFALGAPEATARDLCDEAIRLARVVATLLPDEPETHGLVALLLIHHPRRDARIGADGTLVALDQQDPARFRADEIDAGLAALRRASASDAEGAYALQAAIAAVHVEASRRGSPATERWTAVAALYERLLVCAPTPVVALNHAVAVSFAGGANAGLEALARAERMPGAAERFATYQPYHAARADLLRRAGRRDDAIAAYRRAIELAEGEPERLFLSRRLSAIDGGAHESLSASSNVATKRRPSPLDAIPADDR